MEQVQSVSTMKGVFDQSAFLSNDAEVEEKLTHDCRASVIALLQQVQGSGDAAKEYIDAGP